MSESTKRWINQGKIVSVAIYKKANPKMISRVSPKMTSKDWPKSFKIKKSNSSISGRKTINQKTMAWTNLKEREKKMIWGEKKKTVVIGARAAPSPKKEKLRRVEITAAQSPKTGKLKRAEILINKKQLKMRLSSRLTREPSNHIYRRTFSLKARRNMWRYVRMMK